MSEKYIRQEENIKNCPFCGCSVSVEWVPLKHYQGCVIFEIKCLNCGCERSLIKNDSIYRTEEEARANAIAQWNERSSTAAVPQEMSAVEYEKVKDRMRQSNGTDNAYGLYVRALFEGQIDEAVAIVERWVQEHPEMSEDNGGKQYE